MATEAQDKLKILLVLDTLSAGGAEIFAMKWASALNKSDHAQVLILVLNHRLNNKDTIAANVKGVKIKYVFGSVLLEWIVTKFDGLFRKMGLKGSLFRWKSRRIIRSLSGAVDLVQSHLFNVDLLCTEALEGTDKPLFITVHGDYLRFYQDTETGNCRIPFFRSKMQYVLDQVSGVTCISDAQLAFFEKHAPNLNKTKIYNGYFTEPLESTKKPENVFRFVMVSRGIEEKGWKQAIEAFTKAKLPNSELHLIGKSEFLDQLKAEYESDNVIFAGFISKPLEYLKSCHVGLLPSYYRSESLPTVIIEYQLAGLPVIASAIGEIPNMLNHNNSSSGILVDIDNGIANVDEISSAMQKLASDGQLYQRYVLSSEELVRRYDMRTCLDHYLKFYQSANF